MTPGEVTSLTIRHEPTDRCAPLHCHSHDVDEVADKLYIACYECGHVYRTPGELRRAYRHAVLRRPRFGIPWRLLLWHAAFARASRISFCQHCIHDF